MPADAAAARAASMSSEHGVHADLLDGRAPGGDAVLVVAELDARLVAVEDRRRDAVVAVLGVAVGDAADVRVDAEDLLDDHQPAAVVRRVRRRLVGGEQVAVGGLELDVCPIRPLSAHACAATLTSRVERSRFRSSATRKASSSAWSALSRGSQCVW